MGVGLLAILVVWAWRRSLAWLLQCHQARVTTRDRLKDPALFRDQHEEARHALYNSLKPPAAKGFNAQLKDRRAHVLAMQRSRKGG